MSEPNDVEPNEAGRRPRPYRAPKREEQVRRTRSAILQAFTDLLADRRADEITVGEIAREAGVSQPTVYRYFPDRLALLEGLVHRVDELMGMAAPVAQDLDDVGRNEERVLVMSERFPTEIRAGVLLNSDPRRFVSTTSTNTRHLRELVAGEEGLDEQARNQLAGILRCLGSSHTWLRLREEWGIDGHESGPLVRWAMETLIAAARDGGLPVRPRTDEDVEP